jgi:catechol 2,3-dioxygenase-like lactoylglutathione lyase family enzyme
MLIKRLHHLQITIPKGAEAEARAFYVDLLGLPEIPKPESLQGRGGFWLQVGDVELHVGTEDGVDRRATKAHPAFQVDDLTTVRDLLARVSIHPLESVPIPGYDRFECRDPFGNRLEFIKPLGDNPGRAGGAV